MTMSSSDLEQPVESEPTDTLYSIDFAVNKSLRYHAARRAFFDRLHSISNAFSAMGASGTFAALVSGTSNNTLAIWASAMTAALQAFDLAFGFPKKARLHDGLYKQFSDLAEEMAKAEINAGAKKEINLKLVSQFKAKRIRIERGEPTALKVLNLRCAMT
jgi:hypothetical protein